MVDLCLVDLCRREVQIAAAEDRGDAVTRRGEERYGRDPIDRRIGRIADRQHGVVTRSQLLALDVSAEQLRGRLQRGNLIVLHRGVYAVGRHGIGQRGHLHAALLALPAGAFLSHRTAAGLRGLCALNPFDIHLSFGPIHVRTRVSFHVHRVRADPRQWEVGAVDRMRVSTIPRLLVELSATEPVAELRRMIDLAVTKQALNHDRLEQALELHERRPGIVTLRQAYEDYRRRGHHGRASSLERGFDALLAQHPEIPPPQRNVKVHGWEADCYWARQRLVLELDGRGYHTTVDNIERDRLRDARLLAHGIRTLRVTDSRFSHDRAGVIEDLKAALRSSLDDAAAA